MKLKDSLESKVSINRDGWLTRQMQTLTCAVKTWNALPRSKHDKSKVVYTLKLEKHTEGDALPNFKFRISSFDTSIQFDNTRFFENSVN